MKDAYYFSHDSNAKDDPKCVMLIEQLGLEGYGIYWVLIETLRDQPDYKYPISLIPALARRYNTTAEKMKAVVNGYNLFNIDENDFFSLSLIKRMNLREEERIKRSLAGQKGNMIRWQLAEQSQSDGNAIGVQSQSIARKGKERKEKGKEIKEYIIKKNFGEKVRLTEEEYQKLINQHGEEATKEMIAILDNWYLTKGKKPNKSDYHTMVGKGWVLSRYKEDQQKRGFKGVNQTEINQGDRAKDDPWLQQLWGKEGK